MLVNPEDFGPMIFEDSQFQPLHMWFGNPQFWGFTQSQWYQILLHISIDALQYQYQVLGYRNPHWGISIPGHLEIFKSANSSPITKRALIFLSYAHYCLPISYRHKIFSYANPQWGILESTAMRNSQIRMFQAQMPNCEPTLIIFLSTLTSGRLPHTPFELSKLSWS